MRFFLLVGFDDRSTRRPATIFPVAGERGAAAARYAVAGAANQPVYGGEFAGLLRTILGKLVMIVGAGAPHYRHRRY
jgi:hypothetical protein